MTDMTNHMNINLDKDENSINIDVWAESPGAEILMFICLARQLAEDMRLPLPKLLKFIAAEADTIFKRTT